jgi:hypothetical protein
MYRNGLMLWHAARKLTDRFQSPSCANCVRRIRLAPGDPVEEAPEFAPVAPTVVPPCRSGSDRIVGGIA